jgi:4-hydroxy-tetrahydrodipicolinate synthase
MHRVEELGGVMPALVSPLDRQGVVDEVGTRRLIERVIEAGATGVVALGSTGESAALSQRQRRSLLTTVAKAVAGRVPLIVGVAQVDPESAADELRAAAAAGACAGLVTPPFYAPPDQPTILDFYRRLASEAILPILVYNLPMYIKVSVEPATVQTLAQEGTIVGMKDSSGNFAYHSRVLAMTMDVPGFRLFMGHETLLLPALVMGSCGTICATANIAPRLLLSLVEHVRQGDLDAARAEQFEVLDLVAGLMVGGLPVGYKAALGLMEVCQPWPAAPTQPLHDQQLDTLRRFLDTRGLLPALAQATPR